MFSADSLSSLGQSPMAPYSLVASTVRPRRPPPVENHSPMMSSVQPAYGSPYSAICPGGLCVPPYLLAVSKKLTPISCAWSMIACASGGGVSGPKFIVPRHSLLTRRPERPRCVYSMRPSLSRAGDRPQLGTSLRGSTYVWSGTLRLRLIGAPRRKGARQGA